MGYPDSDTKIIHVNGPPEQYLITSYVSTYNSSIPAWASQPWGMVIEKDSKTGELKVVK
jgi:hypothetical protein